LTSKASINDTGAQCHEEVRQQFNRRSHMPLPEGQTSCADSHNPHGALTNNGTRAIAVTAERLASIAQKPHCLKLNPRWTIGLAR
jgi:hypothetical protein